MNPGEFDETNEFLPAMNARKQKLKVLLSSYNFKLESEIRVRDLSEEKKSKTHIF